MRNTTNENYGYSQFGHSYQEESLLDKIRKAITTFCGFLFYIFCKMLSVAPEVIKQFLITFFVNLLGGGEVQRLYDAYFLLFGAIFYKKRTGFFKLKMRRSAMRIFFSLFVHYHLFGEMTSYIKTFTNFRPILLIPSIIGLIYVLGRDVGRENQLYQNIGPTF